MRERSRFGGQRPPTRRRVWGTHITWDIIPVICVSLVGEHISLRICVFQVEEHISLLICVSWVGIIRLYVSLVICVPLPGKHIPLEMCSPTWETHIPSDMCSPTQETHIPSNMCSPSLETYIPSDMCSPTLETYIISCRLMELTIRSFIGLLIICFLERNQSNSKVLYQMPFPYFLEFHRKVYWVRYCLLSILMMCIRLFSQPQSPLMRMIQ